MGNLQADPAKELEELTNRLGRSYGWIMWLIAIGFVISYGSVTQGAQASAAILTRSISAFLWALALVLVLIIGKIFDAAWKTVSAITQWTPRTIGYTILLCGIIIETLYVFGAIAQAILHITLTP